jgi:SAM-dependent MidA family methyltransferase
MNNVERLSDIIKEIIRNKGPVTFAEFMDMALYWPGLGYYTTDRIPFGPSGDFYTSGHLSPVFGWMLALQIDEMRAILGNPDDFCIIEIGPGRGFIAEGILEYSLEHLKWPENWKYVLIEKNPTLLRQQREYLKRFQNHLLWYSSIEEADVDRAVVIANEVFDALPVHLVQYKGDSFQEIYVDLQNNEFHEQPGPLSSPEIIEYINRYNVPSIEGYRTEIPLKSRKLLEKIFSSFNEVFLITIDYGWSYHEYYDEERAQGTLLCYKGHTAGDNPYEAPGEQDITAHVNFSYLKDVAEGMGIKNIGFIQQGTFLISLGIDRVLSEGLERNPAFIREIQKIKGLILGMGETHKVLIQYKGDKEVTGLKGLSLRNRLYLL